MRIGIATGYRPLAYVDADGNLAGVEPDLAHELGAALSRPIEFEHMMFEDLLSSVDEVDIIMSGLSITEDRSGSVAFAIPYMQIAQMALIRSEDFPRFRALADIGAANSGSRVGAVSGTTGERCVLEWLGTVASFQSVSDGVAALRNGQIQAFVHDAPAIWDISLAADEDLTSLYQPLSTEQLGWAVSPGDPLLGVLNAALQGWISSGKLERILDRHMPVRVHSAGSSVCDPAKSLPVDD